MEMLEYKKHKNSHEHAHASTIISRIIHKKKYTLISKCKQLTQAIYKSSGENGREVVRFVPKNPSLGIREPILSRQCRDLPITADPDGVAQQMAWEVRIKSITCIQLPVSLSNAVHLLHTPQALGLEECVVGHPQMLLPERHSEPVDLASGRPLAGEMARLVCPHCDLCVAASVHGSLVDIGRSDDYVLIINWTQETNTRENVY